MEIAIIVLMALVCLVTVLGIILVICDFAKSRKKAGEPAPASEEGETEAALAVAASAIALATQALASKEVTEAVPVEETAEPAPVSEPVAEPASEPVAAEEVPANENGEVPNVAFSADPAPTHAKKYAALSDEARGWYDEIAAYAAKVEGAKQNLGKNSEEYKIGNRKIVRFTIRKGVTVCEFIIRNSNLDTYATENGVSLSNAATTLKVTNETVVPAAKDIIDLVVEAIEQEKINRRRIANEKRRARYAAANAAATEEAPEVAAETAPADAEE